MKEECYSSKLDDNMNISNLKIHAQQVDKIRVQRKSRYANRARSYVGGSSKGKPYIKDKPRIKKRFCNQVPSKFPNSHDHRVPNPMSKKGRGTSSPTKEPTCGKCGKKNYGGCLIVMHKCINC